MLTLRFSVCKVDKYFASVLYFSPGEWHVVISARLFQNQIPVRTTSKLFTLKGHLSTRECAAYICNYQTRKLIFPSQAERNFFFRLSFFLSSPSVLHCIVVAEALLPSLVLV